MDASSLGLAAFILTAIGWISREIWRWRRAKRLATEDAVNTLNQKKTLIEDMIAKTDDSEDKNNLITQLDEVNAALAGLYGKRLRHTLKEAGFPTEEELIADGRRQLQPQETTRLKKILLEVDALLQFLPTQDFFVLGDAYYYTERYKDALAIFNKILNLNPKNPIALAKRGVIYASMGKHIEALADLNHSLELSPNDPATLTKRGATLHNLKEYKEALSDYNRSLELRPDDALTYSNRGATYKRLEKYDEALADFNHSLKLKPDFYPALLNRGSTYECLKKYHEAISDYNRSFEIEPNDIPTLYDLARVSSILGKAEDALDYLKKVIDKDKRFREVAKTNRDFDNIQDDPRFKNLILRQSSL